MKKLPRKSSYQMQENNSEVKTAERPHFKDWLLGKNTDRNMSL
jgi:hypothetical protein